MDNPNLTIGKWEEWMRRMDSEEAIWKNKMLGDWSMVNDAVYSREEVQRWLSSGRIDAKEAERLLRMRYEVNSKGERSVRDEMH